MTIAQQMLADLEDILAGLAVWFVLAATMGLFIGAVIRVGGSDKCSRPAVNPEDIAELEARLREKREVVEA